MNALKILERLSERVRCITISENIWIGGTSLWYYEKEVGHLVCLNMDGSLNEGVMNKLEGFDDCVFYITKINNKVLVSGNFIMYGTKKSIATSIWI